MHVKKLFDFLIIDKDSKPVFIVEVKEKVTENNKKWIKEWLFNHNILYGLIVTPQKSYLIKDTAEDFTLDSFEEKVLDTPTLLSGKNKLGKPLKYETLSIQHIKRWLQQLITNWDIAIPMEYTEYFVPEIVGAIAGGELLVEKEQLEYHMSIC